MTAAPGDIQHMAAPPLAGADPVDLDEALASLNLAADPGNVWGRAQAEGLTLFYDSAEYEFPPEATHIMEYASGDFTYKKVKPDGPPLHEKYPFIHSITVLGGSGGWRSQFLDYEQFNQSFINEHAERDWAEARITRGLRAVFYCDRANLHRLRAGCGPLIWSSANVHFWIPTLDGRFWSPAALSYDIAHNWGLYIPQSRIWANQARDAQQSGGPWDTSVLFGSW